MVRTLTLTGVLAFVGAGCASSHSTTRAVGAHAEDAPPHVDPADLAVMAGPWSGVLSYRDYGSGETTSIAVRATGQPTADGRGVTLRIEYPDEPGHEEARSFALGEGGRTLGGLPVVERSALPDGGIRLVLEERGVDGNDARPATFQHALELRKDSLVIAKNVRFDGTSELFERHAYRLKR